MRITGDVPMNAVTSNRALLAPASALPQTTKSNKGKPSSEMMLAEQNYFATHPEGKQGKDIGKGYSVDLIERKQER